MWLAVDLATCSGVPEATIWPPPEPPSGPRSTIQSALLMTSRLCSMVITVLPFSTRPWSTMSSLRMSSKCRPGGGLVQHVDAAAVGALLQLRGQLDALRLAAGERGGGLAQPDVAQADVHQRVEVPGDRGEGGEELRRLPRSACSGRPRWSCPCNGPPGSPGCTGRRGRPRRARRRPAGSSSRSSACRRRSRPRSGRP